MTGHTPVTIVSANGTPVIQVAASSGNAVPATVCTTNGTPIVLVSTNGTPMHLYNENGTEYSAGGGGVAPVNTVAPAVTGTAIEGYTLTTDDGTWTGDATIVYTYQWNRGGTPIGGATANTHVLVAADEGQNVTCTVTGTNGAGADDADSNTVAVFDPTDLFAGSEKGFILDPTRIGTLWTDTAGTSAVTADADLVARVDDRSDNGWFGTQATSAERPQYNVTAHAQGALLIASTDHINFTTNAASAMQAASYGTIIAFVNAAATGANQLICGFSSGGGAINGRFQLYINSSNKAFVNTRRLDADSAQAKASTASVTAADHVLTAEADWANTVHGIAVDLNAAETAVPTWGAGSATSNTAGLGVSIGSRTDNGDSATGADIGRVIAINRQLTSDERTNAIKWCGKGGGMSL